MGFEKSVSRIEKEDISSVRLMMPKLRTPSNQQCRINKVLSRPLVKGTDLHRKVDRKHTVKIEI